MLTGSRTTRPLGALLAGVTLAGAAAVSLAAPANAAAAGGVLIYGLTTTEQIVSFRADAPQTTTAAQQVVLATGEDLVGIDVRPATGELYGVVNGPSSDRLIVINPANGGVVRSVPLVGSQLRGLSFGVDFNPAVDRLRVVSDREQNLRINPVSGSTVNAITTGATPEEEDESLRYAATDSRSGTNPEVSAAAYTNNVAGVPATATTLLGLDLAGTDTLVRQAPPNEGVLNTVGATGSNAATRTVGLDVEAVSDQGFAVFSPAAGQREALYRVNVATGVASNPLPFATTSPVEDIAVASPRLLVGDASGNEGGVATVTVTRVGDVADTATAVLTPAAGSATAGDFDPATRTVTFAPGATTATAAFPLTVDTVTEQRETFTVTLSGIGQGGGNTTAGDGTGVVTILDGPARSTVGRFHPITPARVLDTRADGGSRVAAGSDRRVPIAGLGGVPATGVTAVVLNVTNTLASARGDLQVYPTGQRPSARTSNLNFFTGETVPVQVQTGVGSDGSVTVSVNTGSTHVVVDVFGWFGDASDTAAASSGYTALQPQRLLDTRTNRTPVVSGADRTVVVGGQLGVPATATAVILNATVLGAPANADLQVYPTGARPTNRTSNLNVRRGQTKANSVTVALGTNGSINLSVSQNSAQVVLDVLGYYSVESRGRFIPLTPSRIFDTRSTTPQSPVRAGADRAVTVGGQGGVPAGAVAAVLSVTGTGASDPVDLQVYPIGNRPANRTSTINFRPGEAVANVAVATLGTNGQVGLSISQGSATVILDAVGYITND